jgi:hypothetical protein
MESTPFQAPPQTIGNPDEQPRLLFGLIGGFLGMLISAAIWGVITYLTNYQIGWMAIGVGFVVGFAVKWFGRGNSVLYGLIAAVLALIGCVLGNLLFYCGIIAREYGMDFIEVLALVIADPGGIIVLLKAGFQFMDLVFYAIALYVGFRTAYTRPKRIPAPQA